MWELHRLAEYLPFSFRVLYRVFLLRLIDLELLASDGDPARLLGQFATVFVTLSFFCTVPVPFMLGGRRAIPLPLAYTFEHFLIETSMTIAGLIAVLGWDSTLPDRRDMLVLGPLPVRPQTLFLSKISATFAAPVLAMLAFNLIAGLGWPLVFAVGQGHVWSLLRTLPAYWFTILAAGAFTVCSVLALQGIAANLLPRQVFLRMSDVLQAALLCLLLCSYLLGPSFNSPMALSAPQDQSALHWLPAYWFLGFFNQLNGSMHPSLVPLAHRAWVALASSSVGCLAALLLCYFRALPKIIEQPDIMPVVHSRPFLFGNSLGSIITLFSLRTLLRSRRHRMVLSVYVGLGITVVVGFMHFGFVDPSHNDLGISVVFLLISTLTMILAVLGLRMVASIPISLQANWVLRITQLRPAVDYHRAVRFSWVALAVVPVVLLSATAFFKDFWLQVSGHLILLLLLGVVLTEMCLLGFQKIPFACSYLPGKANLHFVFWIFLFVFLRVLAKASSSEGRMLHDPQAAIKFLLLLTLAAAVLRKINLDRAGKMEELQFDETSEEGIISLRLN